MAQNDSNNINKSRTLNKDLDLLSQKMDGLYKDIYISRPDNKNNLDDIINNLDASLDKLQGADSSTAGMSELLRRIDNIGTKNSEDLMMSVKDLFENQNVLGTIMANDSVHRFIAGQNYNYDLICKYLPKLQDALEIKRDNVLCSDNFSKSFINPKSNRSSRSEVEKFASNCDRLEDEYEMSEFLDKTYMNTSKYGEDFIYVVPYNVAFERLFKRAKYRINRSGAGRVTLFEGYSEQQLLKESFNSEKDFKDYITSIFSSEKDPKTVTENVLKNMPKLKPINLHFNKNNAIIGSIEEFTVIREKVQLEQLQSLSSVFESSAINEAKETTAVKMNSVFNDNMKESKKRMMSYDGLITNGDLDLDPDKIDKNLLGAVLERIPRENIIPVYIGKKCLGYYYLEFAEDPSVCGFCGGHHATPMLGNGVKMQFDMNEQQQELAMRYISARISRAIDTKFINANKDLKEEIYAILNYNDKFDISRTNDIGITFIPAEDMIHTYFEINEYTHRGISDLERAVTPAMLYILLYLTDIIGKITRSTDKRVYYVKQNVETNIARTMMNVVQQIKKGNLGMRQIESMTNILNIVGRFQDLIIPLGPSGDSPVQFEVMQGQDIQTPTDLMEKMEESAVNTIIPFEFVNTTYSVDFATRFSMSNTRFLKTIYTRQRKTEKFFSKIYTKVYNYEYGTTFAKIEIILPPPTYLTMTNNSQLIDNINQMADKIIEAEMDQDKDEIKQEFKRLYLKDNLNTYLDYDRINKLKEEAKVNVETKKPAATEDGDDINGAMEEDEF